MSIPESLLTIAEAAAYLRMSESAVYALCEKARLGHYRLGEGGGRLRTTRALCDAYLEACFVPAAPKGKPATAVTPPKAAPDWRSTLERLGSRQARAARSAKPA